jgi:hypothetical protein
MAEILVSVLCESSPAAAHRRVFLPRARQSLAEYLIASIALRIVFSIAPIASAPTAFLLPVQGLAL